MAALAFALTALAYLPGLHGGFLFDDSVNLEKLGAFGPVDDFRTLLFYLTSGTADPTGRPVSLLTFLLDARNWPADPYPFKRTNLVLHLLNGALLLVLLRRFEQRLSPQCAASSARWVALLGAVFWMAHPLMVSTTLYVIQREAMLPLTFCLLALLAWDKGFGHLSGRPSPLSLAFTVGAVWLATVLAVLSKANGALTPVLGLVVIATVYRPALAKLEAPGRKTLVLAAGAAFALPSLATLGIMASRWAPLDYRPLHRDWSIGERLLTEPRVLFDYLHLLFVPRAGSAGLYVEGFAPSQSLLQPATTLIAILGLLALLACAWSARRRFPAVSCALLFFLVGHSMEGSFIPLELYFEHRNYVPAALLFWPIARWLVTGAHLPRVRVALAVVVPLTLLTLTWQRASVWGDPTLQAVLWGQRNTDSIRSQTTAAMALGRAGNVPAGVALLAEAQVESPESIELAVNRIALECQAGRVSEEAVTRAEVALRTLTAWNFPHYRWLQDFAHAGKPGLCPAITQAAIDRLMAAARANPSAVRTTRRRQNWYYVEASRALALDEPAAALQWYNKVIDLRADPGRALRQAATLGNHGYPALGVQHLDYFRQRSNPSPSRNIRDMAGVHAWLLEQIGYWHTEFAALRRALNEAALEEQGSSGEVPHD